MNILTRLNLFCATILLSFFITSLLAQSPQQWKGIGTGGGGALFAPSINPVNPSEMYVACDMGGLYHSTNHGKSWKLLPFQQIRGGHYSRVNFTKDNLVRYAISYKSGLEDQVTPAKTVDGGLTWTKLPGNPDDQEMLYALYVNKNNPDQILLNQYNRIYFSNNGGTTFSLKYIGSNTAAGCKLSGVFWEGNSIYCGTNDGVVRSTDSGQNFALWTTNGIAAGEAISSFTGAKEGNITRFYVLTSNVADIYNGDIWDYTSYGKKVYSMDNASGSWTDKTNNFNSSTQYVKFIRSAQNDIDTVYLAGETSAGQPLVLRTINAGQNWSSVFLGNGNQNIYTAYCGQGGDFNWGWAELFFGMEVCASNSSSVLVTDYGFIHRTTDAGNNWYQCYADPLYQHPSGAATPIGQSYASAGDLNQISVWQVYWQDANHLWAAASDVKGIKSVDKGNTWNYAYTNHPENSSYRVVRNTANSTMYMATSSVHDLYQSTRLSNNLLDATANTGSVKMSTDNGQSWQMMHDFSDIVAWVATDPNNSNKLFASVVNSTNGNGGIWQTANASAGAGSTWTKLPDPPRTSGHPFNIVVLKDGNVLVSYSGQRNPGFTASSGVFLWNQANQSWTDCSDAGMYYWTQDVIIDPHDPAQNTWYACVYDGWGLAAAQNVGGLYKTTNRGQSWTKIWANERCMSATISPVDANEMYVTTEYQGLFYTNTLQATNPVFTVTSYPFRNALRVFYHPYNNLEIWVTGFGGGIMKGTKGTNYIKEEINNEAIKLYPQPASQEVNIQTNVSDIIKQVGVYTLQGQLVTAINTMAYGQFNLQLPNNIRAGIYVLELTTEHGIKRAKLMVAPTN